MFKNFLKKFLMISLIFSSLIFIMGILEEINFFKELDGKFFYPYFVTLLNLPITLFEIFPFIFLTTTIFFLNDLIKNDEITLLKKNGLSNLNIVSIVFFLSIAIGLFNIIIYYNIAAKLKFYYSDIKNNYSNDNKYLAMVIDSGLWIKDEVNKKKYITKSNYIDGSFLYENIINEFDSDLKLIRIIQSEKIDITSNNWIILNPIITFQDNSKEYLSEENLYSNFNSEKINNLFSNVVAFDMLKLLDLKKDYKKLGYSVDEINIQFIKLFVTPLFYGLMSVFSIIVVFNFTKNKPLLFNAILGVILSVIIYYLNFIFNSLGLSGKIPIYPAVLFPLLILTLFATIGLININEK